MGWECCKGFKLFIKSRLIGCGMDVLSVFTAKMMSLVIKSGHFLFWECYAHLVEPDNSDPVVTVHEVENPHELCHVCILNTGHNFTRRWVYINMNILGSLLACTILMHALIQKWKDAADVSSHGTMRSRTLALFYASIPNKFHYKFPVWLKCPSA